MLGYRYDNIGGDYHREDVFQPDNEDRFGESDGVTIWIARMKMSDEELVRRDQN